jgi:hypothetical protein
LPPDIAQRLKALVSPEVAQKLQQLAQNNPYRLLTPQVREMIALVLEKRRDKAAIEKELHRLELWLDSEIDRKLWDRPTAAAASEKIEPSPVASAEQAKPVSTPAISEPPPAPSPPPPQEPTPIALAVQAALAALSSPSPSEQPLQEPRSVEPQPAQSPPEEPPQESSSDPEQWLIPMREKFFQLPKKRRSRWVEQTAYPQMQRDLGDNAPWKSWGSLKRAMYPGRQKKLSWAE